MKSSKQFVRRCSDRIHSLAGVVRTPANSRSVRPTRILHGRLERTHDLFRPHLWLLKKGCVESEVGGCEYQSEEEFSWRLEN